MSKSILDVKSILNEYSDDIQEGIIEAAQKVAKDDCNTLKNTSPKKTGKYSKGWRVMTSKRKGEIECIIHNSTNYQLTHLLEKSHLLRNGRKSTPQVHIYPVEQRCVKEFEKKVETIIENGGVQ